MKFNLGCGTDVREGFVNVDGSPIDGVDLVHDLAVMPWPIADGVATEVILINVLEHLPDTVRTIEELRRICRPGAIVRVRVPFYNSPDMFADPTHRRFFSERTFNFFDPRRAECRQRPYYSPARFEVKVHTVWTKFLIAYIPVRLGVAKRALLWLGRRVSAVVWVIEFEMKAV